MSQQNNPIFNIRRDEWPLAGLMFGYFFLVITSFWILKPIKKSLFIQFYDVAGFSLLNWHLSASQAELIAKVLNMAVAFVAVVVFTLLVRKLRRQWLTLVFSLFFICGFVFYSQLIDSANDWTVWSFYLFGDLFSTLMVATFFAFLNDSVTPEKAKRLYGIIGLGGVVGGVFGTTAGAIWIESIAMSSWLWICVLLAAMIIGFSMLAGRLVERDPEMKHELADTAAGGDNAKRHLATRRWRGPDWFLPRAICSLLWPLWAFMK